MISRVFICTALCLTTLVVAATAPERPGESSELVQARYAEAMAQQSYEEAERFAKQRLEIALARDERHELKTANLYMDLARAQRLGGNPKAAQSNYQATIDIIQSHADMLDIALERPLLGLGQSMLDQNRPDLAVAPLERAVHIRQVNDGPHDSDQIAALQSLASAFLVLGDSEEAGMTADRIGYLVSRNQSDGDLNAVAASLRQAAIYRDLGRYEDERTTCLGAIALVKNSKRYGKDELVEPHIRTAESFLSEYFHLYFSASDVDELPSEELLHEARRFLEESVTISRQSDANWQLRHRALLALGDFYTMTDDFADARRAYRDSWELLTADPDRHDQRRKDLESVAPLLQPIPRIPGILDEKSMAGRDGRPTGHITTSFTVTRRGRLSDIGLVEIFPERNADIESSMKESLADFVYRPRMQNGFIVATPNQLYRLEYAQQAPKSARD